MRRSLLLINLLILCSLGLLAQANKTQASDTQQGPKLVGGHPDLQGNWSFATITPLERPIKFEVGNKADEDERETPLGKTGGTGERWVKIFSAGPTMSPEDTRAYEKAFGQNLDVANEKPQTTAKSAEQAVDEAYNSLFFDQGDHLVRTSDGRGRTSLIIDPVDGRVPYLKTDNDEGKKSVGSSSNMGKFNSVKDRPLGERCIVSGAGPITPSLYNNNLQIVETPNTIMIMKESMHEVRYIHMDRAQHVAATLRLWMGDSIGHWEGDTLVVDTTNFTDKTKFMKSAQNLHLVERFRRTGANTIVYRATMDDATTFSQPWTIEYPFFAQKDRIYEYACHEGNIDMEGILGGKEATDSTR